MSPICPVHILSFEISLVGLRCAQEKSTPDTIVRSPAACGFTYNDTQTGSGAINEAKTQVPLNRSRAHLHNCSSMALSNSFSLESPKPTNTFRITPARSMITVVGIPWTKYASEMAPSLSRATRNP